MTTINEEVKQVHRVMVTVSDPNHTMQTQRKTKIMKRVKVTANDRDHAIDSAIHHYKKAGYKVHDHEYLGRIHEETELEEGYGYNHHDNRTGFAKRRREDDEYHVPDPVGRTHKIAFDVSKDGGEKHNRTVTISNSTKSHEEAKKAARDHLEKQGYKIHEEVEQIEESYEDAERHKDDAESAKEVGDHFSYHMHMADHHGALADWHYSKGRNHAGDKHSEKAADHEIQAHAIKSMKKEEIEIDEAIDLRAQLQKHSDAAIAANRAGDDEKVKHHMNKMNAIKDKMAKQARNEEVAANNVGNGNIAGTQGDAGKKAIMTKEPLKRKSFKQVREARK